MLKFISKLLGGNKSEKDVAQIKPIVEKINKYFAEYASLSNDALRNKTQEFRATIKAYLTDIDGQIAAKQQEADNLPATDIHAKDAIYQQVDKLKKERDKKIEEVLQNILPEAFAVVKETARRFSNNAEVMATATDLDRELSVKKEYISIKDNQSVFQNSWTAGGTKITWNMVHYDVQLIGG
ncbi:MAG: preprotein translocase subunit SecA, partial [Chitinophagaceae bacterium]